nr:hypothetical protein [Leadbetterella sp.]
EDVSEESFDEDSECNEEFSIIDSTFSASLTQPFKSDSNSDARPSLLFFTKLSRFIFFRNLRI